MTTRGEGVSPGLPYEGAWVNGFEHVIGRVSTPSDISSVVTYLQSTRYQRILGDEGRSLVVPDNLFRTEVLEGLLRSRAINPLMLPTALWQEQLIDYHGDTKNLKAKIVQPVDENILPGPRGLCLAPKYIDPRTITAFDVTGDLIGHVGQVEGSLTRRYALYLTKKGQLGPYRTLRQSVRDLIDQAAALYPEEDVYNSKLIWLHSKGVNFGDAKRVIEESIAKVEESSAKATEVELFNKLHPLPGGLPGLGKDQ